MSDIVETKRHMKLLMAVVALVALIAAMVFYFMAIRHASLQEVKVDGMYLNNPTEINDFKLADTRGKTFTKENLKGHWTLMFFGFTNCGMVCPTTMAALKQMIKTLKVDMPADNLPQVVMVSVDPERDSIKRMKQYMAAFNPKFIGARADTKVIAAMEKQLHLISVKMQSGGKSKDQYTINHSAEIIVFNPEGKLQAYLSYPHTAEQMVIDYKSILKNATVYRA